MPAPLILARSFKEAHAYAQGELGLTIGFYRVVNSVGTIKAVRNTELHLVPGWDKRPGHHAFRSALRYCKLTIVDPSKAPAEPVPALEPDTSNGGNMVAEGSPEIEPDEPKPEPIAMPTVETPGAGDAMPTLDRPEGTPEPVEMPSPEAPKAKRRTRCKECGNLHFKGEPCIESEDA